MTKQEQVKAFVQIVKVVADTIKELGEVPSGHLYAQVMGLMSLDSYQNIINTLVRSGIVTEKGNLLKWVVK